MASVITNMLLMKCLDNKLENTRLKNILAQSKDFIQVGVIAPYIPYAIITDKDYFFSTQSKLADKYQTIFKYHRSDSLEINYLLGDTVKYIASQNNERGL